MIYLAIYVLGVLWFTRINAGFFFYELNLGGPDVVDFVFSVLIGFLSAMLWPLTFSGWCVYALAKKYLDEDALGTLLPKPRKIESRAEREQRILDEQRQEILDHRRRVNEAEAEAGMTLTRWENL